MRESMVTTAGAGTADTASRARAEIMRLGRTMVVVSDRDRGGVQHGFSPTTSSPDRGRAAQATRLAPPSLIRTIISSFSLFLLHVLRHPNIFTTCSDVAAECLIVRSTPLRLAGRSDLGIIYLHIRSDPTRSSLMLSVINHLSTLHAPSALPGLQGFTACLQPSRPVVPAGIVHRAVQSRPRSTAPGAPSRLYL